MDEFEFRKSFGKRLCIIRKEKNLTQERLAELIELDPQYYCKMENGNHFPSVKTLAKITQVFGMGPDELFNFGSIKSDMVEKISVKLSDLSNKELEIVNNFVLSIIALR